MYIICGVNMQRQNLNTVMKNNPAAAKSTITNTTNKGISYNEFVLIAFINNLCSIATVNVFATHVEFLLLFNSTCWYGDNTLCVIGILSYSLENIIYFVLFFSYCFEK